MQVREFYQPDKPTLLMSLHPEMAAQIGRQEKVLEFRRRFYREPFQTFVCVTGTNGGVGLFLDIDQPLSADVATLIRRGVAEQGDDPASLRAYFESTERGVLLPIRTAVVLEGVTRQALRAEFPHFVAPRAYQFLSRPAQQPLLRRLLTLEVRTAWTR